MPKRECPSCAMEVDTKDKECPVCGYEFPDYSNTYKVVALVLIIALILLLIL